MTGNSIYQTGVLPEWIDYNGHLRDAYYGVIVSLATDALMDRIGMDADYRKRTGNTLFTVEMHQHFLHEVHATDTVDVRARILGVDQKRLHLALDLYSGNAKALASTAEVMLIHVHQGADKTSTSPFEAPIREAILGLQTAQSTTEPPPPGSRRMQLPAPKPQ